VMGIDSKLQDEAGRLAALQRYEVLDTAPEPGFDRITSLVSAVMNVPMCTVSLIDADRQWFKSCVGLDAPQTGRDISFCTHTVQQREPLFVPDAMLDERFAKNPLVTGEPFIRSYLGVPLATPDGYNVGSLCVIDRVPRSFTAKQIDILQSFAALVVDELEMRRIAQTDHLTGVATRRSFTLELEKALAQFRRSHQPTALVLLDIDHFKQVNDTYGHPTGDRVLVAVAQTLGGLLRGGDTIGRLGGEEFGILLQDVGAEVARETAERLRGRIEATSVDGESPLQVTASFGIAVLEAGMGSVQPWMARADEALYEAKRTGRNRCCLAERMGD
jgi:diguanylate cyclase (GGDEF)-like protein